MFSPIFLADNDKVFLIRKGIPKNFISPSETKISQKPQIRVRKDRVDLQNKILIFIYKIYIGSTHTN